jgi:hypothetical protein
MRNVSNKVPVAIVLAAIPALIAVLAVVLFQQRAFPDALPQHAFTITALSSGPTQSAAAKNLAASRKRAIVFLRSNGFAASAIEILNPTFEFSPGDGQTVPGTWEARQQYLVKAESYALSARLSNRLERFQGKRADLFWDYPAIPFFNLAVAVGVATILCLTFSVVSLETREADVTRAPRGMHPVVVFAQTLMFALLGLCSLVAAHLIAFLTAPVLLALLAIGVISLGVWLYKTRVFWNQSTFLLNAYRLYTAALVIVVAAGAFVSSHISPT